MKCKICGSEIENDSVFCGKCGSKIESAQANHLCPVCGAVLNEGAAFCSKCGARADGSSSPQPYCTPDPRTPEQRKRDSLTLNLKIRLLVMTISGYGISIYLLIYAIYATVVFRGLSYFNSNLAWLGLLAGAFDLIGVISVNGKYSRVARGEGNISYMVEPIGGSVFILIFNIFVSLLVTIALAPFWWFVAWEIVYLAIIRNFVMANRSYLD